MKKLLPATATLILIGLFICAGLSVTTAVIAETSSVPSGKGANYMTGYGIWTTRNIYRNGQAMMDADFTVCNQAGIDWLRVEFPVWPSKYYKDPNAFPAVADLRSCLSLMRKHDIRPVLNLLQWHYAAGNEKMRSQYKQWLSALVRELGSQVTYYEVGNEENLEISSETKDPDGMPYAWDIPETRLGGSDPAGKYPSLQSAWWPRYEKGVRTFVAFLSDSHDAIKNANPDATVILGGISSWHSVCYLQELTRFKAYKYADAVGWHAYPLNSPPTGADAASTVNYLKAEMLRWPAGKTNMPIWITEFGFSTDKNDLAFKKSGPHAESKKAEEIAEEWRYLRGKFAIRTPIFIYTARDWPITAGDWKSKGPGGFGLFERGNPYLKADNGPSAIPPPQLLPAYGTFRNLK